MLTERYQPVTPVVPDVIVAVGVTDIIHHPVPNADDEPEPRCGTPADEYEFFQRSDAMKWSGELCRGCFEAVLWHLADNPDSQVTQIEPQPDATPDAADVPVATPDGGRSASQCAPLATLTGQVSIQYGNGSRAFHAPLASGETICGRDVDQIVDRGRAPRSLHPCRECFDDDLTPE